MGWLACAAAGLPLRCGSSVVALGQLGWRACQAAGGRVAALGLEAWSLVEALRRCG